jgi:hypothetical protein
MPTTTILDEEGSRLFGLYEASSVKEFTAARQLLYPSHRLLYPEYMTLLGDLQATRRECNDKRLAVEAHRTKVRELDCVE